MASRSLNVNITGDVNPSFTRAMAKADNDVSKLSVRFGGLSGSIGEMLPALGRAAPALAAVAVAGTSVASSLAAAAGGAAALGAGLAASLAPMLVVGKQVTSRFEEIKKAYEAVQTAQREGTAESKKQADQALANLSRNERAMVGSLGRLSALQEKVLGGASDRVFGGLSKAIDMLAPKLEGLAKPFDRLGGAMSGAIGRIAKLLSDGPWQSALHKFVDSATGLVRPITSTFEHIANILRDVAVAALPYVQKAVQGVATWFGQLDRAATSSKIREIVRDLVKHTESWFNLFKEIGKLAGQVFGATAESGRGLVDMMTDGVKAVNAFVGQMRDGTGPGGRFASALGDIKDVAVVLWPLLRDAGSVSLGLLSTGFARMKAIIEVSTPTFLKVKDAASVAFGWLRQNVPPIFERVKAAGQVAFGWLQANVPPIFEKVKGAVSSLVGWLGSNVPPAFNAVKGAVVTAFGAVKGAVSSAVQFVRGWINKHEDDIRAFGQAWKNIGKGVAIAVGVLVAAVKEAIEHVLVPVMHVALDVVKTVWPSIKKIIGGVLDVIGGLIQVFSGVFTGDFGRMWDGVKGIFKGGVKAVLGIVTGAAKGLLKAATGLAGVMLDGIGGGLKSLGHFLAGKIGDGISWAVKNIPAAALDALKSLGGKVLDAFTPGSGDGIGKQLKKATGDGLGGFTALSGGNTLMGAKSIMAPFASMAGRFGLHTSSGARPGAITSSGNVSWHSSGNAIDEAGTPAGMLGYFRFLKNTFGSRLRELIYTPGGVGIKDGKPYQYTGAVAADHYDHVHVAFTGDGHGRTGDGPGRSRGDEMSWLSQQWAKVAPAFGLDSKATSLGSLFKHIRLTGKSEWVGVTTDIGKGVETAELLWPSWLWRGGDGQKPLDDKTKLKLFIHEMAHRFQSPEVWHGPTWETEGGAEAFARLSMDRFFGGYKREHDDPYSGYTTRVMRKLGVGWVTGTQFGHGATASASRKAGTGDGIGFSGLESLWVQGGGSARMAPLMAHIAQAESGGNPNAYNRSGATGLWQILGAMRPGNLRDPLVNARNAVAKYNAQGLGAWAASRGTWGRFVGSGETYSAGSGGGSRGSSSGGSGGSSKPRTGSSGGPPPTVDNKAIYGITESTIPTFANTFGTPPVKGRGDFPGAPHKGGAKINPDGTDPRQVARDLAAAGPSEYDYLDLALANAEATTGTDDDRSALTAIRDYRARALNAATATGDPRQIATARRDLTSAESALTQLTDALTDNATAIKAQTDALTAVQTELQRQTDVATSIQSTEAFQLKRYLADVLSGEFGRGIVARSFTAGTGVETAF